MKLSKEFKVGLLAIVSITILYFGFNFLKGIDLFQKTDNYYAVYDNIDGLTISNPVIINGLSVGRVSSIQIMQKKGNLILVEMSIDGDVELGDSTVARLINSDFLGSKAIELLINNAGGSLLSDGDTLKSSVEEGISEFLKESAGPVANKIDTTISRLNAILANFQGNSVQISNTLANLEVITASLRNAMPNMERKIYMMMDSMTQTSTQLNATLASLKPTLDNAAQLTDSLKSLELSQTLEKTQLLLDNLNANLASIKAGEGTIGKLMTDDSLYVYLSNTTRDLDKLFVDLQANPGRYVQFSVFGKKDKSEKKKNKDKKEAEE